MFVIHYMYDMNILVYKYISYTPRAFIWNP